VYLVAFDVTVSFCIGDRYLEVPLLGGASKRSAAVELKTKRFFEQPPPEIMSASDGVTVTSVPLFLEIMVMG